jgi:two-component system NtrC family sensor kinase
MVSSKGDSVASLFVIQGRDQGKRYDLTNAMLAIGREANNVVQLHDTEVSRRHAELRKDGATGQFFLTDLGSSNGTYVNSERVAQHVLKSGDRVQIGRTLMLFTDDQGGSNVMDAVDIVGQHSRESGSRIIRAVGQQEGSQIFGGEASTEAPWLARARSNLQIMYRTALAVSHTLDIEQLLDRILELIFEWVESDRGCVMLVDRESEELTPTVRRNRKGQADDEKMLISRTILDYVMQNKEGVLTSDASDDQRFDPSGSIIKMGVREAICVPMQGRYGIVGVIYIDTYTPPGKALLKRNASKFSEEHLKLMVAIGHQAALAVEDTSYYSAMVQAERLAAMGQTIATLSHHVKNILQGIRGGSYLIDEGLKATDFNVVRKGWRIVEKNQEKISNLVMDMLTFSKERKPDMIPALLNETVADVVELMQVRARDAEVKLLYQPQSDIPELLLDPDALHRAILNVVTNAIDACEKRENAAVAVATHYHADKAQLQIVVADNGEGISPEDIKKIFNVFESRKGSRGTGLGLPVSQKILREHGGDIRVESTWGVGSKFILEFPAVQAEVNPGTGFIPPLE